MFKASAVYLALSVSLFAAAPKVSVEVTTTERAELASGGGVRVEGSYGELNIETWDEPGVEVVVTRSAWAIDNSAAKLQLDAIKVTVEKQGNDVVITTPRHPRSRHEIAFQLDYRIMVPRSAHLTIHHLGGDVVIGGVEGALDVSVKTGDILMRLPASVSYSFDADCREGRTHSDFPGTFHRRHLYAEHFTGTAGSIPVHLHVGIGGIDIRQTPTAHSEPRP